MTRGFINVMKWGSRATKPDREVNRRHDAAIAVLAMVGSLIEIYASKVGYSYLGVLWVGSRQLHGGAGKRE